MTMLLKNAVIYDGSGEAPVTGDIRVKDERILEVGENLAPLQGEQVLDLTGLSVAPGFIDAHSHNDWFAIRREPLMYFEPFLRQGITTFVAGNCGLSAVGFEEDSPHQDKFGGGLFGFQVAVNPFTAMAVGFLGLPGAVLVILLQILL